jgi:hypothetical protein
MALTRACKELPQARRPSRDYIGIIAEATPEWREVVDDYENLNARQVNEVAVHIREHYGDAVECVVRTQRVFIRARS